MTFLEKIKNTFAGAFSPTTNTAPPLANTSNIPATVRAASKPQASLVPNQIANLASLMQTQKTPWSIEELNKRAQEVRTPAMKEYSDSLDILRNAVSEYTQPLSEKPNVAAWLGVGDILGGTNRLEKYQTPEMQKRAQQKEGISALENYSKSIGGLGQLENALLQAQILGSIGTEQKGQKETPIPQKSTGAGKSAKNVPASELSQLADFQTIPDTAERLYQTWTSNVGPANTLADVVAKKAQGLLPNSAVNTYMASLMETAQIIGKPLEGGKLTDADFEKYKREFLPLPGDSDIKARNKLQNFMKYAADKYNKRINIFSQGGYDTGTIPNMRQILLQSPEQRLQELRMKKGAQ